MFSDTGNSSEISCIRTIFTTLQDSFQRKNNIENLKYKILQPFVALYSINYKEDKIKMEELL